MFDKNSRHINDEGKVGVLISSGYGAGWSSWLHDEEAFKENPLFSPTVIQLVLDKKIGDGCESPSGEILDILEDIFPYGYLGGARDLSIEWVESGTFFRIDEYDGAESLILMEEEDFSVA